MKKFTFTILLASLCYLTQAQITVNHWEFSLNPQDTFRLELVSGINSFPTGGADQIWDYSANFISNGFDIYFNPVTSENQMSFPNANTQRAWWQSDINGGLEMDTMIFASDDRGLHIEGVQDEGYSKDLFWMTGVQTDSIHKMSGDRAWSTAVPLLAAPLNYGDSATTVAYRSSVYTVDAPSVGIINMQIERRRTITSSYNVIGWGKLIATDPITSVPDTFEVLLQTRSRVPMDNFYDAGGNLIQDTLLANIGLMQGQISDGWNFYEFWTRGPNHPALTIEYPYGATSPSSSYFTGDLFETGFNVNTQSPAFVETPHQIYPNPVRDHQFQLEIDKTTAENWTLSIHTTTGQLIQQETITNNISQIELHRNLPAGTYIYAVNDEKGQFVATGKLNVVK